MIKNLGFCLLNLSLIFCLSAIVFGQQTTDSVEGTVKDEKGGAIPGVGVTLSGLSVGFNRTVQADNDGTYRFQQVPPGTYKITTAAANGFAAALLESVTVTLEKTTTVDVTIGV